MKEQKKLEQIYEMMNLFKESNASAASRRGYLAAASRLYEIERRLSEITNSEDELCLEELEVIEREVKGILQNLGITRKS